MLFAIELLLLFRIVIVAGTLTSNVTEGVSCRGDVIAFYCTQDPPDTALQWRIRGPGAVGDLGGVGFFFSRDQPPLQRNIASVGATATLLSTSPTVESTLTLTVTVTAAALLDGARVECSQPNAALDSEVINIASPPSPPQNVMVTVVENGTTNVTVNITWDNGGGAVDGYAVQTSPPSVTFVGTPPDTTSVRLVLSYNVRYNVTVTASNCAAAGSSSSVEGPIEFVGCPLPSNPNVTIEPYTNSAVGSVIYYKCSPGFIPEGRAMSVCGGDGMWDTDPDQYSCTEVDCGDPRLPENSTVIRGPSSGNRNGSEVTFQCNEGLFPSMEITIVCTSEERWQQDPEMMVCTDQPASCSRPSEPTNGFLGEVTSTTAEFGCDSDPQENMAAQCVATDTWNPDPAQEECSPVTTTASSGGKSRSVEVILPEQLLVHGVTVLFVMVVTVVLSVVVVVFILRKKENGTGNEEDYSEANEIELGENKAYSHVKDLHRPRAHAHQPERVYVEEGIRNEIKLEENQAYGHIKVPHRSRAPAHQPEPAAVYDEPFTGPQYNGSRVYV